MSDLASFYRTYFKSTFEMLGLHNSVSSVYQFGRRLSYIWDFGVRNYIYGEKNYMTTIDSTRITFILKPNDDLYSVEGIVNKEADELLDVYRAVNPDDVFYDVGANVGVYSCIVGSKCDFVVSFEPLKENVVRLYENLDRNPVDYRVVESALSNRTGEAQISRLSSTGQQSDLDSRPGSQQSGLLSFSNQKSRTTSVTTGDEFVDRCDVSPPDVLKIDVEGAEYEVLEGMQNTIEEHCCRVLYLEIHPEKMGYFDGSEAEIFNLLEGLGYDIETRRVEDDTPTHNIKATLDD